MSTTNTDDIKKELNKEDLNLFWKKVLGILETELNPSAYGTWIKSIVAENLTSNSIDLTVPMEYNIKQLEKYSSIIQDTLNRVGKTEIKFKFVVKKQEEKDESGKKDLGPLFESKKIAKPDSRRVIRAGLNPRFTFENFIMGNSNQLAYAIAQAVSENLVRVTIPSFYTQELDLEKHILLKLLGIR